MTPAGTTTSADFCPVNTTLTSSIAPANSPTHRDRPPQIRTFTVLLPPPHLHTSRFGGTGFTICCWLTPTGMPHMRFVSLGAGFRLRLPSHPASQRRSCHQLGVKPPSPPEDSHLQANAHAGRTTGKPPVRTNRGFSCIQLFSARVRSEQGRGETHPRPARISGGTTARGFVCRKTNSQ